MLGLDAQALVSWVILIISTSILVFALYKILYDPVLKILDDRKERIGNDIENAKISLTDANKMKAEYTEKIENVKAECEELLREATQKAKYTEETIIAEAKMEAERVKQSAMREIELSKQKAKIEMQTQIIEISSLIASRYVEDKMDEALQNKLLDETIKELGSSTWLS